MCATAQGLSTWVCLRLLLAHAVHTGERVPTLIMTTSYVVATLAIALQIITMCTSLVSVGQSTSSNDVALTMAALAATQSPESPSVANIGFVLNACFLVFVAGYLFGRSGRRHKGANTEKTENAFPSVDPGVMCK